MTHMRKRSHENHKSMRREAAAAKHMTSGSRQLLLLFTDRKEYGFFPQVAIPWSIIQSTPLFTL